jgi:hypothetical protein
MATQISDRNDTDSISPASLSPTTLGGALLNQIRSAVRVINDPDAIDDSSCIFGHDKCDLALDAANNLAQTLALVPPQGPAEALAAAILIYNDLDSLLNGSTDFIRKDARLRVQQRVAGLAAWIETTHRIDRCDWGLDHFDGGWLDKTRCFPHTSRTPTDKVMAAAE